MAEGMLPWGLVWKQVEPAHWQITLTQLNNDAAPIVESLPIRQVAYPRSVAGKWQIDYIGGLVQVQHEKNLVLAAYLKNDLVLALAGTWQVEGANLFLTSWQEHGLEPSQQTHTARQELARAVQLNQVGLEAKNQKNIPKP